LRHFTLVKRFFLITVGFYIVRPVEAFCCGSKAAYFAFKDGFMTVWNSEGFIWTPKMYYKESIELWRKSE
jgi:hypothetical protein